jgi:hypothetical protein
MGRLLRVGILLLAGCQSVVGPLRRPDERVDDPYRDDPRFRPTVPEQFRRERDQIAFPDGSNTLPRTGAEIPNAFGR